MRLCWVAVIQNITKETSLILLLHKKDTGSSKWMGMSFKCKVLNDFTGACSERFIISEK